MSGIAHVTTLHARGDIRITVKEAASLAARRSDVTVFVQDGLGDGAGPGGVAIVDTGPRPAGRLARMTLGTWRMARAVAAARPTVAHFHDPELIPAALWWKLRGIPVIYDVHEDLPRQILSKPWIPALLRRPVAGLAAMAERVASAAFDGFVAVTPGIAARFPAGRTALVQNFPDLAEMSFENGSAHADRAPRILYLGNITEIRGPRTMVEAMARVRHPDARLAMIGAFNPPALEREIQALPGWNRVDHPGWVDRDEVRRNLARSRLGLVLYHPVPNHLEAQPNKMFEYLAAGLPVVASDFPHWRSLLADVECAIFVDPMDPEAVARAIDWLLDNPQAAQEMGQRGCQAVQERFNWSHEADALAALYDQVLTREANTA